MKFQKKIITFAFMISISIQAWANPAPPLPVKQNIGMPDTALDLKDSNTCELCHNVDPEYIKVTHHLTAVNEVNSRENESNFNNFMNGNAACDVCHRRAVNILTGDLYYPPSKTCVNCHASNSDFHHQTDQAQQGNCFKCHGGLVRGIDVNTLEGKIPDASNIGETINFTNTSEPHERFHPYPSNKPSPTYDITNIAGTSPGNCNFCHDSGINSTEPYMFSDGTTLQIGSLTNSQTHHKTSFFEEGKCAWCHNISMESNDESIRICQRCHDKVSLHSIEFDALGDGLQPGNETPYLGHVGNSKNCIGCHGDNGIGGESIFEYGENTYFGEVMAEMKAHMPTPTLTTLSTQMVDHFSNATVQATGVSFVNTSNNPYGGTTTYSSKVHLTDKEGNVTVIEPNEQSYNSLEFTVPSYQPTGYYNVTIHKYNSFINKPFRHSAPIALVVKPKMLVDMAISYTHSGWGPLVIIRGYNIGNATQALYKENSGYSVIDPKTGESGYILYWKKGFIVAAFDEIPDTVTVTNLIEQNTLLLDKY